MDGYRTTEVIRAKPGTCRLPIVALTAKALTGESREMSGGGIFRLPGEKAFNTA
jgi:CheY-like chemotaxis protein